MKQQERERLQRELLEITGFRQVLSQYYFTLDLATNKHDLLVKIIAETERATAYDTHREYMRDIDSSEN